MHNPDYDINPNRMIHAVALAHLKGSESGKAGKAFSSFASPSPAWENSFSEADNEAFIEQKQRRNHASNLDNPCRGGPFGRLH